MNGKPGLKMAIKVKCQQAENRNKADDDSDGRRRINELLSEVQQEYAIFTADKASNTYVIHCKPHLCRQVNAEIQSDSTYKPAQEPAEELTEKEREFLLSDKLM